MNILLLLMLLVAVLLYGSELLEATENETSLVKGRARFLDGQVGETRGREKLANSSPAIQAEDGARPVNELPDEPKESSMGAEEQSKGPGTTIFQFYGAEPAWNIVNDTVMGGISRSKVEVDQGRQRLVFSGTVSLENNGGFASTRSEWATYDLRRFDGVALHVRGDGHVYRFRIRSAETGRSVAYTALFPTVEGEWQQVYIPFASMVPLYRGMVVSDAGPLAPAAIRSFGLMVADKQEGPFALEVDWINAVVEKESAVELIHYTADGQEET